MTKVDITKSVIFRGMSDSEADAAMKALAAAEHSFAKDEIILHAGDTTEIMGLVLDGSVRIESNDVWGNRTILSHVEAGQVFAETYALLKVEPLLVDAVANQDTRVLLLNMGSIDRPSDSSAWKLKLISNLLSISMRKNLMLSGRIFHTSPKSIRGRVTSYLSSVSLKTGSDEFDIPFDRQQLADYLNVERTALSKELGKMQSDGLIRVKKNHFKLEH